MSKQRKTEIQWVQAKKQALWVTFDSRLKLEFHGSKVTSDAGLLAYRELDEALGLTDLGEYLLSDWRTGQNTQHTMVALMRQPLCCGHGFEAITEVSAPTKISVSISPFFWVITT